MANGIYYIDANSNYYIDNNNNKYIYKRASFGRNIAYIYTNGSFKRAKPIIIKTTNMGKIPENALMTKADIPYLTNDKQFVLTTGSSTLTPESSEDYILYEFIEYSPQIF